MGALNVELSPEEIAYLEELYQPHPIVGALPRGYKYKASRNG